MKNLLSADISFYILIAVILLLAIAEIYSTIRERKGILKVLVKNRSYSAGDTVEGVVVLRAKSSFSASELKLDINYYLKPTEMSYGRALNEVLLQSNSVLLFGEKDVKSGKKESFPFQFDIPLKFKNNDLSKLSEEEKTVCVKNSSGVIEIPAENNSLVSDENNETDSTGDNNTDETSVAELSKNGSNRLFITIDARLRANGIDLHGWKALKVGI